MDDRLMKLLEWELERVDWATLRISARRSAAAVPDALRALASAETEEAAEAAYWRLDNNIVVQGCLYEAAEHVVGPLMLLLCDGSDLRRQWILNLLIELVGAAAYSKSKEWGSSDELVDRCRARVREGLSVLYWLLDA